MSYQLVSYCSENYSDAFDFVIQSWLRTSAERIIVYTDTAAIKSPDPRVIIVPHFDPSDDWLVSVGRKIQTVCDFVYTFPKVTNFAFMDIDCYIAKDIEPIFDHKFDIAVTRLLEKTPHVANTASAAPWYGRMSPRMLQFVTDWARQAEIYKAAKKGVRKHKVSYVQYSFTDIIRRAYQTGGPYTVFPAQKNIWNCEDQNDANWLATIREFKSYVIHFKSRKFRNPELAKQVFAAIKGE